MKAALTQPLGRTIYDLTLLSVEVVYSDLYIKQYLDGFYSSAASSERRPGPFNSRWQVVCSSLPITNKETEIKTTTHGARYSLDSDLKQCYVSHSSAHDLAVTARKLVREIYLNECERLRFSLFHCSIIYNDNEMIFFVGDKETGKTTLALDGYLNYDYKILSNDHGLVVQTDFGASISRFPTYINIKLGTLLSMWPKLRDKLSIGDAELKYWRDQSERDNKKPFYILPIELGLTTFPLVKLDAPKRRKVVVFPSFVSGKSEIRQVNDLNEIVSRLIEHSRDEWVYDQNGRGLMCNFSIRSLGEFKQDSLMAVGNIANNADAYIFRHRGSIDSLIKHCDFNAKS